MAMTKYLEIFHPKLLKEDLHASGKFDYLYVVIFSDASYSSSLVIPFPSEGRYKVKSNHVTSVTSDQYRSRGDRGQVG